MSLPVLAIINNSIDIMSEAKKTVLISTIQPVGGGVPQMVRFVMHCLSQKGYEIRLAYYEPYSVSPSLSVPLQRLLRWPFLSRKNRKPQVRIAEFEGVPATGIGCWIPELEFTNYWKSSRWQTEIERCDFHLCVSGSNLAALPYWQLKMPFLAWIATPWLEDREHRVNKFPWYRRCLDKLLIRPVCQYLERRIHQTGNVVALSDYTRDSINQLSGAGIKNVLPTPIDVQRFKPLDGLEIDKNHTETISSNTNSNISLNVDRKSIKIGFIGRFEDPRKNINLLLQAFALCNDDIQQTIDLELVLVGDTPTDKTKQLMQQLAITEQVTVKPYVSDDELPQCLQELSLFVIPSHQEGLCIAALEAMSCGVPVISTRCGGPESYLKQGENGLLIDNNPTALKRAILQIIEDTATLNEYSRLARQTVVEQFSITVAEQRFWQFFAEIYPESISSSVSSH